MAAAPIIDQPPESLDRVYAQSLFDLVEAEGGRPLLEEIAAEIEVLDEGRSRDPQVLEFFRSRIIGAREKGAVLSTALRGKIHPLVLNLMLLLAKKERLDRTGRVFAAFDQLMQERFGKIEVDVYTRFALPQEEIDRLRTKLQSVLQREPIMHAYIDESMIGGIKLQVGDKMMDASIATSLRRMREKLLDDGASEVRGRIGKILGDA